MRRDWSLMIGHDPGLLGWLLLVACLALALAEIIVSARRRQASSARARRQLAGLVALRLVAIFAVSAVVVELGVRVQTYAELGRRVVVLVDRSASMDLADGPASAEPGAETTRRLDRLQQAWAAAEDARASWREQGVEVELRSFASTTEVLSGEAARALALTPDGRASDLARALVELAEVDGGAGASGPPLAGVVVLSDGLVARDQADHDHLRALVDELGVPLTTVSAGGPTLRDVAIAAVHVGEFAFVENVTEFSAELVAHGCAGERVEVELLRDGEQVERQIVRLGPDGARRELSFEIAPDRTGQFVYEFRARPVANEASVANNSRAFVVKVLRDKVRVLHVAGRPDWDVRALRTLLKRDPNVELLSYYILRDQEDTLRDDGTAPLSLIAFPTDQLFREELGSFDLIVMHNFDAAAHGDYLGNVADYVREGGSLAVIGGDLGLGSGDFAVARFSRLMPIDLRRALELDREPFAPRLTAAGRRHPVTAWLAESGRGDWHDLPALDSFNAANYSADAAKLDTAALLVHPTRNTTGGKPMPLLAVAEPGKGRVMTLTTGSSWRLGFAPDLPLIDGARPYDLLWLGAVRWLLRDASAERLSLEIEQDEHELGEPIRLAVRTLSASYAPEPEVEVVYEVRPLDPDRASEGPVARGELRTDGLGRAATTLDPLPPGAYRAEAWRSDAPPAAAETAEDGDSPDPDAEAPELGQAARRVFLVGADRRELALVDADPGISLLADLADRSEGQAISLVEGDALPEQLALIDDDELERAATGRADVPVWDSWWALVLALAAFGGEWILRRRVGLS